MRRTLIYSNVRSLDVPTRELVRLSIVIATATEHEMADAMVRAVATGLNPVWIDELVLQSYLFVGFPRAINAAREWRRVHGRPAPVVDEDATYDHIEEWRARGTQTCEAVYGSAYKKLRQNIRDLHPALDEWMLIEGYGKVLSRPGLQLWRRELCIVAVCGVLDQDRQLLAHLYGAVNVGASVADVEEVLSMVSEAVSSERSGRMREVWDRVERPQ
ncbi:MAG: carboxymuconolactone decarboxylase family protein [Gemmatimonadaceae bacterium]